MDAIQSTLFGEFPRFVGNPRQFPAFNEDAFDVFLAESEGSHNCYARIGWMGRTGDTFTDSLFFDFDADVSVDVTDTELIADMRSSARRREEVLDAVVADVRSLAQFAKEQSIPTIGVYTGKGVHVHLLTEPRANAQRELLSNQRWLEDVCDLDTLDPKVVGDTKRLCRVPNCRRYDETLESTIDLYTVPLSRPELCDLSSVDLLEWSRSPRTIDPPGGSRLPLFARDEYVIDSTREAGSVEAVSIGEQTYDDLTEDMEAWLRSVLQLPCMYERVMTRNPDHLVRFNAAVMMFNVGLTPEDVVEVYGRLGWHDYDAEKTRRFATQIYESGYSDVSCARMQEEGLCVYARGEREGSCEAYGYPGGRMDWV